MDIAKTMEELYTDNRIRTENNAVLITVCIDARIRRHPDVKRYCHHDYPPDKFLENLPLTWLARMLVEHGRVEFDGLCTLTLDADDVPTFTIAESLELEIAEARDAFSTYGSAPTNRADFIAGDGKDA